MTVQEALEAFAENCEYLHDMPEMLCQIDPAVSISFLMSQKPCRSKMRYKLMNDLSLVKQTENRCLHFRRIRHTKLIYQARLCRRLTRYPS